MRLLALLLLLAPLAQAAQVTLRQGKPDGWDPASSRCCGCRTGAAARRKTASPT